MSNQEYIENIVKMLKTLDNRILRRIFTSLCITLSQNNNGIT